MTTLKSIFLRDSGIVPYIVGFVIIYAITVYIYDVYAFGVRKNKRVRKREALISDMNINIDITSKACSAMKHFEFHPEILVDYSEMVFQMFSLYMTDLVDIMLLCKYDTGDRMNFADEYKFLKIINNFLCADSLIFEDSRKMRNCFLNKLPKFNNTFFDFIKSNKYAIYDSLFTEVYNKGFSVCTDPCTDDFYRANKILRNLQDDLNRLCEIYNIDPTARFRYSKYYIDLSGTEHADIVLKSLKSLDNDLMSGNILIKSTEELLDTLKSTDPNLYSYQELKKLSGDMNDVFYVWKSPDEFVQQVFNYIDKLNITSMISIVFMGLYHLHDTDKFSYIIPDKINEHSLHTLLKVKECEEDHDICMTTYKRIIEYLIDFSIRHEEMKNETDH